MAKNLEGIMSLNLNNPLQMNDWEIKKFLEIILVLQLAVWGAIGLDATGLQIPLFRQLLGFVYLIFVPGIIILRILKLHKLGNIETLLYTVGLSIATLMFTGLFMNTVYPLFGISGPISIVPFIITLSVVVSVLCILSYVRDKDFSDPGFIDVGNVLSPPALFLCLIPFLAVFGTYLMNFYQNNILILILIVVVGLVALLIGFDKFIHKKLYPLAVFAIAISLLYHQSLISMYVSGHDIQSEYYLCDLVKMNAIWDPTMFGNLNAMLSLVMLAPIYSIILNMELTWVFKIIYPLLFSLAPLGLYCVFQKQTDGRIAFLACFFFMSLNTSFGAMPRLARQEIAELFLVLLILLMIGTNIDKIKRSFLFIVFGISLVVSHYGLSYIYMFCLIAALLMLVLAENPNMQELKGRFLSKFGRWKEKLADNPNSLKIEDRTIHSTFVLLFVIFTLTWYMYVSSSSAFNSIVLIGDHIASSIFTDFLNPGAAEGLHRMMTAPAPGLLHEINREINYLNQIFIVIGCVFVLLLKRRREKKFERDYSAFSVVNLGILFASIAVPFFASPLNMVRVYQIALIFLAPFCVIGGITVLRVISKIVRVSWTNKAVRSSLKILSVYFVIFLLYQTGFVFYVTEGQSTSISLNSTAEGYCFNDQEVSGAMWLNGVKGSSPVYADEPRWLILYTRLGPEQLNMFTVNNINRTRENSYIYFGTRNAVERDVALRHETGVEPGVSSVFEYINSEYIVDSRSKIYTNGGCEIYK